MSSNISAKEIIDTIYSEITDNSAMMTLIVDEVDDSKGSVRVFTNISDIHLLIPVLVKHSLDNKNDINDINYSLRASIEMLYDKASLETMAPPRDSAANDVENKDKSMYVVNSKKTEA